jgi:histone H3/H4
MEKDPSKTINMELSSEKIVENPFHLRSLRSRIKKDETKEEIEESINFSDPENFLPLANVTKIMRIPLDPEIKIAKDAKEAVVECSCEFIAFITSEACQRFDKKI